jgi:alpha-methylacyl-CoA racemase
MPGPLAGLRVIELAGLGPGPFAAMVLADLGADVLRIDRVDAVGTIAPEEARFHTRNRSRRSAAIDLKHPDGRATLLRLVDRADVLIEGFRPGVMERLGVGPDTCLERRPRLVYGRMTGWGQTGPDAAIAGHDINYIAATGVLDAIGRAGERPLPPLNLVGDYGGGGMLLVVGILAAVFERATSGQGQVIDAAMTDGASLFMTVIHGLLAKGDWRPERGTNLIDTGAPFYEVYETAEGGYLSVGAYEAPFYRRLVELCGLDPDGDLPGQWDRDRWPEMKERFARVFKQRTQAGWCELLAGEDVCVAPVVGILEAPDHPQNRAREAFVEIAGVRQPAPAPRFDRTPASVSGPPCMPGEHTDAALRDWGVDTGSLEALRRAGAIA